MAKRKDFSGGIDAIFSNAARVEDEVKREPAPRKALKKKEARTTMRLDEEMMERAKAVAFWERKTLTCLITESLESLFLARESANGEQYVETALDTYRANNK